MPDLDKAQQGRSAYSPWSMPLAAWKQIAVRTWKEASTDNVGLIAAGTAFYGFLALIPLLGATVLTYGLVAAPETVLRNVQTLTTMMPKDVAGLIGEQLIAVVSASGGKKGLGLLVALAVALFGARNAAGAVITALNVAYEEDEKRGFIMVNLIALAMTATGVLIAVLAMVAIGSLSYFEHLVPGAPPAVIVLGKAVPYAVLALVAAAAAATLYRYGPSRERARWTWISPGSLLFALLWLGMTWGFGFYVSKFGNYGATYGSLSAIVVLLSWLYLSAYVLVFGAELNSELEHQTARDTTSGPDRPLGARGAWVADHVADN